MRRHNWNVIGLLMPIAACAIGFALWWRFSYSPLNELELPLAAFINGLTGRSELFDQVVIFLNHLPGEALFVVIIIAVYALFVRWEVGPSIDWRPVVVFAAYIFAFWVVSNGIGDFLIEKHMPRDSPSYMLPDHPAGFVDLESVRETEVKTESRSSFPSNHGSVFFTVFSFCLLRFGRRAWVLLPIVIALSMPRCFTGAHWVSDTVVGSWLVTWLVAAVAIHTPLFRVCLAAEKLSLRIPPSAPVGEWPSADLKPTR